MIRFNISPFISVPILGLLMLLLSVTSVQGQSRRLRGLVVDQAGVPLEGVSIGKASSKQQARTGAKGEFDISLSGDDKLLMFSMVGYMAKTVEVEGKTDIKVVLDLLVSELEEVVVIGYGTVERKDLTGSVGSVNIQDLQKAPVKTFDEALAGRVAGVQVTSSEGYPGSNINIVIRGNNSITQSNYPLFVIDGFPMESPSDMAINPLNTLEPNDIVSIDVLKDASATAIYGARGANGVIIVTTKRGQLGKPTITYNGYQGIQENPNRISSLNPYEFVKLQYEIDPIRTNSLYLGGGEVDIEDYRLLTGINWEDEVTRIAPMSSHYLNMLGGSDRTKYSATLSHTGQDGVLINSGFKRTLGKIVLDQTVNNKLKVGLNATYSHVKNYGSPTSTSGYSNETNMLFSVWSFRPVAIDPNINLVDEPVDPEVEQAANHTFNPVLTAKNELRENSGGSLNANGYLEYDILENLKLKIAGGYNVGVREYDVFNGRYSRSGFISNYAVSGSKTFYQSFGWQNANTLTYNKRFNSSHYIDVMAGFTAESGSSRAFGGSAILLPNEGLGLNGLDEGIPNTITSYSSKWALASFISRVNYKLFDRFLFTATMRADGSSRFQGQNRWAYFPSVAAAWQMDKEKFIQAIPEISSSKLRVSYGVTGNNAISNFASYRAMATANPDGANFYNNFPGYTFGGAYHVGLANVAIGNPNLKWESTRQIDIGYNLGLFKERLKLEVDVYEKRTTDLLLNADMSPNTGYFRSIKNIGKVSNRGLEFSISYDPIQSKNFTWNAAFNIGFNNNKVLGLADNQNYILTSQYWGDDWRNIPGYIALLNSPIAQFYGFIYDGVYGYDDFNKVGESYVLKSDVPANNASGTNVQPGDVKYRDLNGDYIIDENDKTIIGNPIPKHIGGLANTFNYKNLDLHIFLQWSYGNDIINANRIVFESAYKYGYNQWASYADRWSPDNQDSDIPGVQSIKGAAAKAYSTRVVEDGSFLRLKTVSLGYSFPAGMLQRVRLTNARIYVSAQNLWTFSNYTGYDPEVSVRNSALTPGFDFSAYPRARTITFGVSVKL